MILTVDKSRSDGAAHRLLEQVQTDIPMVLVSRSEALDFNEDILLLKGKKWVLVDYNEMGWDWDMKFGHHFGVNTEKFPGVFHMDKWQVFDDFVKENPPALTLSRELLREDVKENVLPISYPCFIPPYPTQTREEFNSRVLEVFYSFGVSHEYRKTLHSQIWVLSGQYSYSVCDNLYYLNGFVKEQQGAKKWVSCHIPFWARHPIENIMEVQGNAKISISVAGSGRNCFRHLESPINSVMLMWQDNLAWGDDWKHGENCLKCEQGKEIETVIHELENPYLYDIYLAGVENVNKYRVENYAPYLSNLINNA